MLTNSAGVLQTSKDFTPVVPKVMVCNPPHWESLTSANCGAGREGRQQCDPQDCTAVLAKGACLRLVSCSALCPGCVGIHGEPPLAGIPKPHNMFKICILSTLWGLGEWGHQGSHTSQRQALQGVSLKQVSLPSAAAQFWESHCCIFFIGVWEPLFYTIPFQMLLNDNYKQV